MSLPAYGTLLRVRPEVLSPDQPMVDMISLAEVTGLATTPQELRQKGTGRHRISPGHRR